MQSLLKIAAVVALGATAAVGDPRAEGEPIHPDTAPTPVTVTGTIDAFHVLADGSVVFKVTPVESRDMADDGIGTRWFVMESTRNANTRPELSVLWTILHLRERPAGASRVVTVVGDAAREEVGKGEEDPIKMVALKVS